MRKITESSFKTYITSLNGMKRSFIIEKKRGTSLIIVNNKATVIYRKRKKKKTEVENKKVVSLFSQVTKSVNAFLLETDFTFNTVAQKYPSTYTNLDKWNKMKKGDEFYYIDISHCFWRIAYMFGYISERLYENVLKNKELKTFRNMALACIVAPKSREYYVNGKKVAEISEDRELYQIIYNNIRFLAYNLMGTLNERVKKYSIAYRTDGIMVTKPAVAKCTKFLSERGFEVSVSKVMKIRGKQYLHGDKFKNL